MGISFRCRFFKCINWKFLLWSACIPFKNIQMYMYVCLYVYRVVSVLIISVWSSGKAVEATLRTSSNTQQHRCGDLHGLSPRTQTRRFVLDIPCDLRQGHGSLLAMKIFQARDHDRVFCEFSSVFESDVTMRLGRRKIALDSSSLTWLLSFINLGQGSDRLLSRRACPQRSGNPRNLC